MGYFRTVKKGEAVSLCRMLLFCLLCAGIIVGSGAVQVHAAILMPIDYTIPLQVSVQRSPAAITLEWTQNAAHTGSYNVYRKQKDATTWGSIVTTLPNGTTSYTDFNVAIGQTYEYWINMTSSPSGSGYVFAGIDVPAMEQRGKVILIVDQTHVDALSFELARLEQDLVGDGWQVIRHNVYPENEPYQVKELIVNDYNADPTNVKSVFLFGHIPVFKSANMAPDGHAARAWPADTYYGDMNGTWNADSPPAAIPSDIELQVGRVDLSYLPVFQPLTEQDLLRRYLEKDHAYRISNNNLARRGFVFDTWKMTTGEPFSANAWGNFSVLAGGPASVTDRNGSKWKDILRNDDYLFSFIGGGGLDDSVNAGTGYTGDLCSTDLATGAYKTHFGLMFGSHFGEWDRFNNLMRSFIAMKDYGLTSMWTGRPNWYLHHLGLGETFGYSARLTQNNSSMYKWLNAVTGARYVYIALMGDPTLRLYPVKQPTNVLVDRGGSGSNTIQWTPADQAVLGYYVYRKDGAAGTYARITPELVSGTQYVDAISPEQAFDCEYMVRSVILEQSPSGTFYNLSQGAFEAMRTSKISFTNGYGGIPQDLFQDTRFQANAALTNNTGNTQDVMLLMAYYDSNHTLRQIVKQPYTVAKGKTQQMETAFYLPVNVDGGYVKAFIWNGLDHIRTLGMPHVFQKQ